MAVSVEVRIDPIRCRGHGICALLFSDGLELDHWGFGRVVDPTPEGRLGIKQARRAAAACPNGAIVISGLDTLPSRPSRLSVRRRGMR